MPSQQKQFPSSISIMSSKFKLNKRPALQLLIRMRPTIEKESTFLRINPIFKEKGVPLEVLSNTEAIHEVPFEQIEPICPVCNKWLRNQTKIVTEKSFYCVGCFAANPPLCDSYRVDSHGSFQVIGGGWPARDEILLLSAIEKLGFGNWIGIQEYMAYLGANYFIDEIQNHYDRFYGKGSENSTHFQASHDLKKIPNASRKYKDSVFYGGKYIEKSTCFSLSRMVDQNEEQIPCYNSKRRQFNIQYKQNLEKYIANMEFRDNDSQKERELKFKILEAYNLGIEDRMKKHNFILEHRLLDENYQAQQAKYLQLNPYANKAHQLLIELMRTMTQKDYLELRKSLQFCLKIQAIIDSLRAVRSMNANTSIRSLGKLDKLLSEPQTEGKPRKKVHLNPENAYESDEKAILKKLNVSKEELKLMISQAHDQNEPVIYKKIKITPINNLAQ